MVYRKGQWNIIDDLTGFKKKSNEVRRNYKGLMVDRAGFEPRHPQETLRVRGDKQSVRVVRKEVDVFLTTNEVKKEDL